MPLKLLVGIVNFGTSQLAHLKKMVAGFRAFKTIAVDIVVHSNIPLKLGGVECIVEKKPWGGWNYLPWTVRKTLYDRRDDYDIYLFSENDHFYREKTILLWHELSLGLPEDHLLGFFQYEIRKDGRIGFPAAHAHYHIPKNSFQWIGKHVYARHTNIHHGGFILLQKHLHHCLEVLGSDFLVYRKKWRRGHGYSPKVIACIQPYRNCGYKKVLCMSRWRDLLIHHLPNKYVYLDNWNIDFVHPRSWKKRTDGRQLKFLKDLFLKHYFHKLKGGKKAVKRRKKAVDKKGAKEIKQKILKAAQKKKLGRVYLAKLRK